MIQISNREAIAAAANCGSKYIDDMRLAIVRATGVCGRNVTAGSAVTNSGTGLRHQVFDVIYSEKYALTGTEAQQRVFIPLNSDRPGVDESRLDWDSTDFSMGKLARA